MTPKLSQPASARYENQGSFLAPVVALLLFALILFAFSAKAQNAVPAGTTSAVQPGTSLSAAHHLHPQQPKSVAGCTTCYPS